MNLFMAVDIGSVSVKGVLMDDDNNVISKYYLKIDGDYITTYGRVINKLRSSIDSDKYRVCSFRLTGVRKRLLERSLGREFFDNEINSLVSYVSFKYKMGTIIDIGNSLKIVDYKNDRVIDYVIDDINYYGKFIDKVMDILDIGDVDSIKSNKTKLKFNNGNTILFDYNVINILLKKYSKEDILLGTYNLVIDNILYSLKNIVLRDNIIITGGLSLNKSFIKILEKALNKRVIVLDNSLYSSCIGVCTLNREKMFIHE